MSSAAGDTMNTRIAKFITMIVFAALLVFATSQHTQADVSKIAYDAATTFDAWTMWKASFVSTEGAGEWPRQRVYGGIDETSTVSEGQAYGMLLATAFDDQELFDGLSLFVADHLNQNGLMHWHIGGYQQILGSGAATDADLDMAMAMIYACTKVNSGQWTASPYGFNYCNTATHLVNAIWLNAVDHPGVGPAAGLDDNKGYELIPGDSWYLKGEYTNGITNLSYFSPAYFRIFAAFTGNTDWQYVIDRGYEIAALAQANPNNCSGLVSNWNQYNGAPQVVPWHGESSELWGWDAARYAWRVALDYHWYAAPEAAADLNEIAGFFGSVGMDNVMAEYDLSGNPINNYATSYFTSHAASAIWAAPNPAPTVCGQAQGQLLSGSQHAYDSVVNAGHTGSYFNDSWRLLTLAMMTNELPKPDVQHFTPGNGITLTNN